MVDAGRAEPDEDPAERFDLPGHLGEGRDVDARDDSAVHQDGFFAIFLVTEGPGRPEVEGLHAVSQAGVHGLAQLPEGDTGSHAAHHRDAVLPAQFPE